MRTYIYMLVFVVLFSAGCKGNKAGKAKGSAPSTTVNTVTQQKVQPREDVTDYDGNTYHAIIIGTQVWMAQNLKVTHYNNGDKIPEVSNESVWREQASGVYCNYDNQAANATTYGRHYNWHAVTDARKLAPKGWHVPTEDEWKTLIEYLGGSSIAGSKLMAIGTRYWEGPNHIANNQSGFTALPAGDRNNNGMFSNKGFSATWWTATGEAKADFATNYSIISNSMEIKADVDDRVCGLSVRCVKD